MMKTVLCIAALTTCATMTAAAAPTTDVFRIYYIGNSVTDTVRYGALAELAATRNISVVWGRHMIPGAPLEWLHGHPNDGFREKPFGGWQQALTTFDWDAVSCQPFDRHLHGKNDQGEDVGADHEVRKDGRIGEENRSRWLPTL